MPYKDIVVGSQMNVHNNVLKIIGYCLETEHPTIVYESIGIKFLSQCIDVKPLPWKCRMKIAADLANAFAYLHTAFARPIIHRDIISETIILDENNVPKLINFGDCIAIPKGQSHVEDDVFGRLGYTAPEYYGRSYLTEKADVYSFGMLLLELLSGQTLRNFVLPNYLRNNYSDNCVEELNKVVDPSITREGIEVVQLLDYATLVARCIAYDEEKRPTMTDVGKELRQIYQNFSSSC